VSASDVFAGWGSALLGGAAGGAVAVFTVLFSQKKIDDRQFQVDRSVLINDLIGLVMKVVDRSRRAYDRPAEDFEIWQLWTRLSDLKGPLGDPALHKTVEAFYQEAAKYKTWLQWTPAERRTPEHREMVNQYLSSLGLLGNFVVQDLKAFEAGDKQHQELGVQMPELPPG
jgi:hypothetical protein